MSHESKPCQFWGTPDHIKQAEFAFKHPDGMETYICEQHCDEYALKHPDAVKSDIA
jgi:hypothetical protein